MPNWHPPDGVVEQGPLVEKPAQGRLDPNAWLQNVNRVAMHPVKAMALADLVEMGWQSLQEGYVDDVPRFPTAC